MHTSFTTEKIKKGDPKAFRMCFDTYHSKVFYYLMRFTRDEDDAEDLTQKVFIKLWENRKKIQAERSFDAYLFTIAHHTGCNFIRDKARYHCALDTQDVSDSSTEALIDMNELKAVAEEGINKLPEKRQIIFRMFYEECQSAEDIAEALQVSVHTVKSQLVKANDNIRGLIRQAAQPGIVCLFWYFWQQY